MSYYAWRTPPDPEPQHCPLCGGTEHAEGCEISALEESHRARLETAVKIERARIVAFLMLLHDEHKAQHNYFSYAVQCLQNEWGKSNLDKAFDRLMHGSKTPNAGVQAAAEGGRACNDLLERGHGETE